MSVDLYWLPLGSGGSTRCVRTNGQVFEALAALRERRPRTALFHAALDVRLDGARWVVEMAPAWGNAEVDRGVVGVGPVGLPSLGRLPAFRYDVRRWRDGPAVTGEDTSAHRVELDTDPARTRTLLDLVPRCPRLTWGRDEAETGEMWNSNSIVSWLIVRSSHDADDLAPPPGGSAPGWHAGLVVAGRSEHPDGA